MTDNLNSLLLDTVQFISLVSTVKRLTGEVAYLGIRAFCSPLNPRCPLQCTSQWRRERDTGGSKGWVEGRTYHFYSFFFFFDQHLVLWQDQFHTKIDPKEIRICQFWWVLTFSTQIWQKDICMVKQISKARHRGSRVRAHHVYHHENTLETTESCLASQCNETGPESNRITSRLLSGESRPQIWHS